MAIKYEEDSKKRLALANTDRYLMKSHNIRPSKGLGQNFLMDNKVMAKIIKAAELKKTETVLEIGPGPGNLTQFLVQNAGLVIAVEKDPQLCQILKENLRLWNWRNVEIIQEDILELRIPRIDKVVANLPYYIAVPVIRKFLETENPPKLMVLMVQKEVAQRICSTVPEMNLLAVSVQFYAKPEIIGYVSKKSFWPRPKVDGAILKIIPLIGTNKKLINTNLFFKIVKAGFSHPRKQIINNLSVLFTGKTENRTKAKRPQKSTDLPEIRNKIRIWLLKSNISAEQRAETLTVENWIQLSRVFKNL